MAGAFYYAYFRAVCTVPADMFFIGIGERTVCKIPFLRGGGNRLPPMVLASLPHKRSGVLRHENPKGYSACHMDQATDKGG